MWGTYWEWDPRLTSELVLLFLYLGYMGLRGAIDDTAARRPRERGAGGGRRRQRADHPLLGDVVELTAPGATRCMKLGKADHAARACCVPLLLMMLGFTLFFAAMLLVRLRGEVLRARAHARLDRGEVGGRMKEFFDMGGYAAFVWPCLRAHRSPSSRLNVYLGAPRARALRREARRRAAVRRRSEPDDSAPRRTDSGARHRRRRGPRRRARAARVPART